MHVKHEHCVAILSNRPGLLQMIDLKALAVQQLFHGNATELVIAFLDVSLMPWHSDWATRIFYSLMS
jgi:hypothetical protein